MARRRHLKITVEGKVYDVVVDDVTEDDAISFYPPPDLTSQVTRSAASPGPDPAPNPTSNPAPNLAQGTPPPTMAGANDKLAPMGGLVLEVSVKEGDKVAAGDQLVLLEAMKMKQAITAHRDGTVSKIHVTAGQAVDGGQPLITIE